MAKLNFTIQAFEDLENISEYISKDSVSAAKNFIQSIITKAEILEIFPNSGRIVPELNKSDIKELIHGNYRIIYKIYSEKVDILTIYHSARLLDTEAF